MSLKLKLIATFGLVFLLFGATIAYSLHQIGRLNSQAEHSSRVNFRMALLAERIGAEQERGAAALRDHMVATDDAELQRFEQILINARNARAESVAELGALASSAEDKALLAEYTALDEQARTLADKALERSKAYDLGGAAKVIQDPAATKVLADRSGKLDQLIAREIDEVDLATQAGASLYQTSLRDLLIAFVAALVLGGLAAVWIVRAIIRGLSQALELSRRVAEGDLRQTVDVTSRDEIGQLLTANNAMVSRLREVVSAVSTSVRQVSTGSSGMAATSEELSQGAQEQASSTEQASASVEQMAANIRQSAENAATTEEMAKRSAENARSSGKAVSDAVTAMRAITDRITIVQEIARQTDLLALNAAVEAARAGEHGRGFAVVASEVRKLAERSRTAADEISQLSGQTAQSASLAGEMLARLVPDIEGTTALVSGISVASRELALGASQVATAIQQLDTVTQQTTSASTELASGAEVLSGQAEDLERTMGYFRLDDDERTAPPNPAPTVQARAAAAPSPKAVAVRAPTRPAARGGFAFEMEDGSEGDSLDHGFRRHDAA